MLLGVFVCALSIFAALRLRLNKNLGTFPLTLICISFLIGLFLIVYTFVLRSVEANRQNEIPSLADHKLSQDFPGYVKWVVVPLLLTLFGFAATAWAAETARPATPEPAVQKPCTELYQDALNIQKDNRNFRVPSRDPDQVRCWINGFLAKVPAGNP